MRFEAQKHVGGETMILNTGWDDLSEAKAAIVSMHEDEHPGRHSHTWWSNSDRVYPEVIQEDKTLFPAYSLLCGGLFTDYTIVDNVSYNEMVRQVNRKGST